MYAHNKHPLKHFLRAMLIVAALTPATLAAAADLPLPPPPPVPTWTWSGLYVGGQIGAFGGTSTFSDPQGPSVFGDKVHTSGFLAGLQVGYDWQVAPKWVIGVLADTNYLDSNGSFTCMQARTTLIGSNCEVSPRGLATVAGRVGFLIDPLNHTLIYGKGGGAWTDSAISIRPNNGPIFSEMDNAVYPPGMTNTNAGAWGGMVGAGIEHALTPAWSLSLEYDFYRFASTNVSAPATVEVPRITAADFTVVPSGTSGVTADMQIIKLALNYHWGRDPGAVWDAPVFGVTAWPGKAVPAAIVNGWQVDAGTRYWYSTGSSTNTSGSGSIVSRLPYSNLTAHSGEFFFRVDTPSEIFVKGFVGAGAITGGKQNDEDWGLNEAFQGDHPLPTAYEVTGSTVSGWLNYAVADVGFNVMHDRDYKFGPFLGYSYFHQTMNAFGCTQLVTPDSVCSVPYPANRPGITQDDTWQALRVGASGVAQIWDRLAINGDVAYLPYAGFTGLDTHWLRTPVTYFPQDGTGRGVQAELILTYRITDNLNVGVGGRYWAIWSTDTRQSCQGQCGTVNQTPAGPFTINTERYGTFVQMSYRFNSYP